MTYTYTHTYIYLTFSLRVYIPGVSFFPNRETCWVSPPPLKISFYLNYLLKGSISKYNHIWG